MTNTQSTWAGIICIKNEEMEVHKMEGGCSLSRAQDWQSASPTDIFAGAVDSQPRFLTQQTIFVFRDH
jgi:hypothetical protein